jgi:hypothetical protein
METAVLRLGLAGFSGGEERAIRDHAAKDRNVHWLAGRTEGADAWLVNGARVTAAHGAHVRVMCDDGSGRAVPVVLDTASRPTAFASPVPQHASDRLHHEFDLRRPATLGLVLAALGRDLHPAKLCFWTAAHILAHHSTIGKAMFELQADGEMLAVVDMKGEVAISTSASESSLDRAAWKHRARKSVHVPGSFQRCPLPELLWRYTTRTRRDLLPERYRDAVVFFRRPPRVGAELVGDVHLVVSRELALGPMTLAELQAATRIGEDDIARALADLYYVGSITSNPERAWKGSVRSGPWSSRMGLLPSEPGALPQETRHTTAPLL